jgi:hypothetical protein
MTHELWHNNYSDDFRYCPQTNILSAIDQSINQSLTEHFIIPSSLVSLHLIHSFIHSLIHFLALLFHLFPFNPIQSNSIQYARLPSKFWSPKEQYIKYHRIIGYSARRELSNPVLDWPLLIKLHFQNIPRSSSLRFTFGHSDTPMIEGIAGICLMFAGCIYLFQDLDIQYYSLLEMKQPEPWIFVIRRKYITCGKASQFILMNFRGDRDNVQEVGLIHQDLSVSECLW